MPKTIAPDATIADVIKTMKDGDHYVAQVLHFMKKAEEAYGLVSVSVGITGKGCFPSFRIETTAGEFIQSYDGQTFSSFGDLKSHSQSWSSAKSSLIEVKELLTNLRNIKSKKV